MDNQVIEKLQQMNHDKKLPFAFDNEKIKIISDKGQNYAIKAGAKLIRVPKDTHSQSWKDLLREKEISKMLKSQNLQTKTSEVYTFSNEDISFAYHDMVPGDILEGKKGEELYTQLTEEQKNLLAGDLAVFFAELHQIPLDNLNDIPPYGAEKISYDYEKRPDFDYVKNKKHLDKFGINLDEFRTPITEDKVFCHNDLHGGNLAIDPEKEHVLNGIFDFGNADINDRSVDFIKICAVDRNLARKTLKEYNKITGANVSMKEVDYQYLNWISASIEKFSQKQLTEEQQQKVFHQFSHDLNMFRVDVLKEKINRRDERLSHNPQVPFNSTSFKEIDSASLKMMGEKAFNRD
ncbi:MAG: aminoglycoside phosphotransferase family protein [Pseudomonadota bacterium]|nr:aminoglycoside phosphotransferase family protein [Pseudomonadota bacterium]